MEMAIIVSEFTAEENKEQKEEKIKKRRAFVLMALMMVAMSVIPTHAIIYEFKCPPECGVLKFWYCTIFTFYDCGLIACWTPPPGGGTLELWWGNCY
jgi:hypothetical protein